MKTFSDKEILRQFLGSRPLKEALRLKENDTRRKLGTIRKKE